MESHKNWLDRTYTSIKWVIDERNIRESLAMDVLDVIQEVRNCGQPFEHTYEVPRT